MEPFETILYAQRDGVAHITLNAPKKHNAMSAQMLDELQAAVWEADNNEAVHCVLLKGAGPSFCSGYDLGGGGRNRGLDAEARYRGWREIDDDSWHL